jgi:hypothetical protein
MIGLHRVALSLNNMGVTMLVRGANHQAMETFKDSIFAMKCLHNSKKENSKVPHVNVTRLMNRATQRLANLQPASPQVQIEVISHDGSLDYASIKSVLRQSTLCPVPVRIEPVGLQNTEYQDIDLESTILLYNLAIAHIYIFMSSNDANEVEQFRQTSLKLLEMVCSVTTSNEMSDEETEDNFSLWSDVANLFVLAAAMKIMAQVLSDVGKSSEAQSINLELLRFGMSLDELEGVSTSSEESHPASAA